MGEMSIAAASSYHDDGTKIYWGSLCGPAAMVKSITKLKPVKSAQKSSILGRGK